MRLICDEGCSRICSRAIASGLLITVAFFLGGGLEISAFAQSQPSGTQTILSDSGFVIGLDWFDGTACRPAERGAFHFRVGQQIFSVPSRLISRARLAKIQKAVRGPDGALNIDISTSAGCKSDPLAFGEVELETSDTALPKTIVLVEVPERSGGASPVTKFIEHLNKTGACQPTKQAGVTICAGTRDSGRIKVFFMLLPEGGSFAVAKSGVPIHVRCENPTGSIVCFASADIDGNVTVRADVDPKGLSAQGIRKRHDQLIAFGEKLRLR